MPLSYFYAGLNSRHEWVANKTAVKSHVSHLIRQFICFKNSIQKHEAGESWITLFIDLVYVAMFMSVGYMLEYCGSQSEVMKRSWLIFLIMFNSRLGIDEYSNRFFHDDVFHRLVYLIYTLGVFIMTLNINYTYKDHRRFLIAHDPLGDCPFVEEYWNGFSYGFFITRGSLLVLYALVCSSNKEARKQFTIPMITYISSMVIISIAVKSHLGFAESYLPAVVIEVLGSMLPHVVGALESYGINIPFSEYTNESYPLDIYEYQARLGIFYMMTLGESMIQLLSRVYNEHVEESVYKFVV
jgi:hypothetical protein